MVIIEVINNFIGEEGAKQKGERLRVHEHRAQYLIEHGLARLFKPAVPVPAPVKEGSEPPKSSGAPTTGPLTGSPSSSAPGPAELSLSSAADPASVLTRPTRAGRRASRR